MSLNNIQLPPIALKELFRNTLIDIEPEYKPEQKIRSKGFDTLGNNQKRILIMVKSEETLYLPDEQLNFLMEILAACNLTMEDVAILNTKKNKSVTYKTVANDLKSEKIFLFGVAPDEIELPIDFPNYQIQQFNNQLYLKAPTLSHFKNNKVEKIKLWNCLKQIFSI